MNIKQLNPASPVPLYRQLSDELIKYIRSGNLKSGEKIPSETVLAENLNIGRPTVRQATELLIRKGLLERRRGSGTFIKEKYEEIDLFSIAGTSSAFSKKGITVKSRLLEKVKKIKDIRNENNPFYNSGCYFFSRLSIIENEPLIIEDFYINKDIFHGIENFNLENSSLSNIAEEEYYLKPVSWKQNFKIGYACKAKAEQLLIGEHTPILIVERYLNFPNAENAVYSEIYCKTDKFVFSQTIGGIYE